MVSSGSLEHAGASGETPFALADSHATRSAAPHFDASCLPSTTTHGTKVSALCVSSVSLPAATSSAAPSAPAAHAEISAYAASSPTHFSSEAGVPPQALPRAPK